jgi:glutathione S-transferase
MPIRRLITIPMSHYCEKARWGLERLNLDYHEERHLQVFHYPRTYWVSRGSMVPVLIDDREVISDSTAILKHLDRYADEKSRLYPVEPELRRQVESFEEWFDTELGVESRRWVYYHMLPHPWKGFRTAAQGTPLYENLLAPFFYPFMGWLIAHKLQVRAAAVETGIARSREIVQQIDNLLSDGRRYLVGGRFTAADLSLACMLSPFVLPPNYGIRLPNPETLPTSMARDINAFRQTRTGQYVQRLFETERRFIAVKTNS